MRTRSSTRAQLQQNSTRLRLAIADAPLPLEQLAFWERLREHCGRAYPGQLQDATPYYQNRLQGRQLVVHFRECGDERVHIPMHVDENRSRNSALTKVGGTIRLKHDHCDESGQ